VGLDLAELQPALCSHWIAHELLETTNSHSDVRCYGLWLKRRGVAQRAPREWGNCSDARLRKPFRIVEGSHRRDPFTTSPQVQQDCVQNGVTVWAYASRKV